MPETHDPYSFFEDRPTLWPHPASERSVPDVVEQRLAQAMESMRSDYGRAIALADEAVALARGEGEPNVLAQTLYRAAGILRCARRPERAYVLCLEVQPLLERQDDRWRASRILLLRGQCFLGVGEHERGLALIAEAAERFRHMEDRSELARCHANMAWACGQAGQLDEAIGHAERAVTLVGAAQNPQLDTRFRNNEACIRLKRGRVLAAQGDVAGAQTEYLRAAALLPDIRTMGTNRRLIDSGRVIGTIATVAAATGDADTLAAALKKLIVWIRRPRDTLERGIMWMKFADHLGRGKRREAAIACARRAVRRLATVPLEPRLVKAHLQLARLLEDAGRLKESYETHVEAMRAEAEQQRQIELLRSELLALDREAGQTLLKTEQTLAYAQRLSNVGYLVASVNHELNQPMASIRMLAETALELVNEGEPAEASTLMRSMLKLGTRLADVTSQLAAFPVASRDKARTVSLRQTVAEAIAMLQSRLVQTPCDIVLDFGDAAVLAHEGQLVRVIANLVNNALDVLETVMLRRIVFTCVAGAGRAVLSVADNGPGLAPHVLERLFQPFFSTKAAGRGLGLGLALSRDVIREMHGELTARNNPAGGAIFDLSLPAAPRADTHLRAAAS